MLKNSYFFLRKLKSDLTTLDQKLTSKRSSSHAFQKFEKKSTQSSQIERPKNFGYKTGISDTTTLAGTREISTEEILNTKNENKTNSKIQSFSNNSEADNLRKVKTLQQPLAKDNWDFDFFSDEKKSKPKGSFADRFKRAIKKEGNFSTQKQPLEKSKKKKQETLAKKIQSTMNREKNVENEIVGQKHIAKNMELELQAEDAEFEKLYECQQCGRSFKRDALEKHQKVCKKVFQLKRKEFEVEEKRIVSKEQKLLKAKGKRKMELDKNLSKKNGRNWKKQSEGLRSMIKKKGKGKAKKKDIEVEIVV